MDPHLNSLAIIWNLAWDHKPKESYCSKLRDPKQIFIQILGLMFFNDK